MKILRIADIPDNRHGGMSRVMYFTGDLLARQGHSVDYLFAEQLGGANSALRRFSLPRRIPTLVRQRLAAGVAYDIVEIHEPSAWGYARQRARDHSLPPLIVISYGIEQRFHELKRTYMAAKNRPLSLKARLSPITVTRPAVYSLRKAQHVLAANMEDVAYVQSLGVPADRVSCYHTGVDTAFWNAASALPIDPTSRRRLLFLATWLERKGTLDLIPAVTRLLKAHPDLTFTAAGCGDVNVKNEFPPDLRDRIHLMPQINGQQELLSVYARHSVLVLPSMFEGQPLVICEAAAAGLAIVTTSCCGMLDFVRSGHNGLLIQAGDADGLFTALDRLFRDDLLTAQLASAARETARHFTWDKTAAVMLAAYQSAITHCSCKPAEHAPTRQRNRGPVA